ncbi:MAG: protein kinase domain-containing protein [Minisyncoccota bacterium]
MSERIRHPERTNDDFEQAERTFLDGIDRLQRSSAKELATKWDAEYERLLDSRAGKDAFKDLFSRFTEFTDKREKALLSIEVPDGLDESVLAEIKEFDRNVILSFRNASLFQGNGATAEVYEVSGHPHMCVKFITNQAKYNENNHLRTEFALLSAASGLRAGRVRTPVPYFLRIHPREGHSFGMEKVEGRSLSQILERPEDNLDLIRIAKGLDREQVMAELNQFVLKMHEAGITHNDLRRRNIMLDREGNLFVIDFGRAKRDQTEDQRHMFRESDRAAIDGEVRAFFADIDKINN